MAGVAEERPVLTVAPCRGGKMKRLAVRGPGKARSVVYAVVTQDCMRSLGGLGQVLPLVAVRRTGRGSWEL